MSWPGCPPTARSSVEYPVPSESHASRPTVPPRNSGDPKMRSTVRIEESGAGRWAATVPPSPALTRARRQRRRIAQDPIEVGPERYLLPRRAASHRTKDHRLGQRVELRLLIGRQIITERGIPLVRFSLKPLHFGADAVELGALLRRGVLPGREATRCLHLLPGRLPARGGVFHHAVQRGVGGRDLRALRRSQAEGLVQRVDRHPVIRRWLEATRRLALRGLRDRGRRSEKREDSESGYTTHEHSMNGFVLLTPGAP